MFEYGSHYTLDGFGIDYSLVQEPSVTNDNLLTMFLNGTFFSETAQFADEVTTTSHPNFVIGKEGQQDLMVHLTEEVAVSFFNAATAHNGLDVTEMYLESFKQHVVTYNDICDINKHICETAEDRSAPIGFKVFVDEANSVKFSEDTIKANATLRFTFHDLTTETFLADYTLENVNIDMNIYSRKEYAQIYGNVNQIRFDGQTINEQGAVLLDIREIIRDDSESCEDRKDSMNSKLGSDSDRNNRYRTL